MSLKNLITLSLFITLSALSICTQAANNTNPSCENLLIALTSDTKGFTLKKLNSETFDFLRKKGPSGQMLAAQVTPEGKGIVFGTAPAIALAKKNASDHANIVQHLGGATVKYQYLLPEKNPLDPSKTKGIQVEVSVHPVLCGSAVHCDDFNDLDIESTIVIKYDGFQELDLHDPDSIAALALELFFKDYIHFVKAKSVPHNGKPFLVDIKTGELDYVPADQEKTKSRALKWNKQDIENGYKTITTRSGSTRRISLREALTSESRTKVDWLVKVPITDAALIADIGIKERYIDANVLFHFAGQNGNHEPVLRIAYENRIPEAGATGGHLAITNTAGFAPMRVSTIAFDPKSASVVNRLSSITPSIHIFYIHAILLNVNRTYFEHGDMLKLLKRLQRRLMYWNDISTFRYYCEQESHCDLPSDLNSLKVYNDIQSIISNPLLKKLLLLKEALRSLKIKREKGSRDPRLEKHTILQTIAFLENNIADLTTFSFFAASKIQQLQLAILQSTQEFSKDIINKLDQFINIIDFVVADFVNLKLQEQEYLKSYIHFVTDSRHKFEIQKFNKEALFISFKPNQEYIDAYKDFLKTAQEKFPQIEFSAPEDLHMTLTFLGKVTPEVEERAQAILKKYSQHIRRNLGNEPLFLNNGVLEMIGTNNNQIGFTFSLEAIPRALLGLIQGMKYELVRAGVLPDDHIDEFLPHISIGYIANTRRADGGHDSIHALFGNSPIPTNLTQSMIPTELHLMKVTEKALISSAVLRYQSQTKEESSFKPIDEFLDKTLE